MKIEIIAGGENGPVAEFFSSSNTPETDAAVLASEGQWSFVLKETCQRLESERDDAVAECKSLWSLVNANKLRAYKAERERDEAREARDIARLEAEEISQELANARKQIEGLNNFANERFEEIQKVRKERDEARKHLAAANKGAEINSHINNSLTAKLAEAKRERDEARTRCQDLETALAYSAEGQTLLSKFLQAVKDRDEARARAILLAEAIVSTLEENRHLADGENCTLAKLKTVVPHWK